MRTLILAFALFVCGQSFSQEQLTSFESEIEKARFLIEQHKEMTNIPGVQVAVMIDGKLVWSEGFGFSNLEDEVKVSPETKFRIASVSKSVTSLALGNLVEEGRINLDADIRTYVPEFPEKAHVITARQLAASVAGVRHYTSNDPTYRSENYPSVIDALDVFKNDPLDFGPNTQYQYSSYGWVLVSAAMERASNQSFFNLMEQSWQDLGMINTSFDYPDKDVANKSIFYILGKKDNRIVSPIENRSYMYAGGGYLSTAEDLAKMGQQLIADSYVSGDTRKALTSSHVLANGDSTYYGLGWETGKSRLGVPVIFHGGSMQSARSHLVIYPEQNVVFAYLSNTGDQVFFNDREAQSIAEIFVKKVMVKEAHDASEINGEWQIETTSLRNKKSIGKLSLKNGQGTITFKRSKEEKSFPVTVIGMHEDELHLIAISPMFIDFYLKVEGDSFVGTWLHDFDVKGVPEADDYWKAREITGMRSN